MAPPMRQKATTSPRLRIHHSFTPQCPKRLSPPPSHHRLKGNSFRRPALSDAIIEARAVEKYYSQPDGNRIQVIAPTDLAIYPGEILAL